MVLLPQWVDQLPELSKITLGSSSIPSYCKFIFVFMSSVGDWVPLPCLPSDTWQREWWQLSWGEGLSFHGLLAVDVNKTLKGLVDRRRGFQVMVNFDVNLIHLRGLRNTGSVSELHL